MREEKGASDQVSARFYAPGYRHGRAFHPRGLQPGGLPRAAVRAVVTDHTRLAPRFIGLVERFLTPLPAERPKQTPLFFIFPARPLAREGGLPNWSRA
jgi:hypothetical protein